MAGPGAAGTPLFLMRAKHAIPFWRTSQRHLVIPPPHSGLCPQGPAVLARCSPKRAFSFWRPRTAILSCAPPAGAVRPFGGTCGQCQASDSPAPAGSGSADAADRRCLRAALVRHWRFRTSTAPSRVPKGSPRGSQRHVDRRRICESRSGTDNGGGRTHRQGSLAESCLQDSLGCVMEARGPGKRGRGPSPGVQESPWRKRHVLGARAGSSQSRARRGREPSLPENRGSNPPRGLVASSDTLISQVSVHSGSLPAAAHPHWVQGQGLRSRELPTAATERWCGH